MSFTSQLQKKSIATSPPIPLSTGMFGGRSVQRQAQTDDDAVMMQRQVGMPDYASFVGNDLRGGAVQAKLTVGAPNDKYEQEADAMAAQVMSMPDTKPAVQREDMPGEEEELQTKPLSGSIQREAMPEEEEVQMKPLAAGITPLVQREEMPEEEEVQAKSLGNIQREEMPGEEEIQAKSLGNIQREEIPGEEEIQAKSLGSIQREEVPEEEEIQAKFLGNIQREEMPEEEEIQAKPLRRSADGSMQAGGSVESQLSGSKGGGSPLPDDVRSFMEPRFGADFSGVRVHTGSDAVQMNQEVNAQAFAHGQDIYFGSGKAPGQNELTAHELTHVVQQTGNTPDTAASDGIRRMLSSPVNMIHRDPKTSAGEASPPQGMINPKSTFDIAEKNLGDKDFKYFKLSASIKGKGSLELMEPDNKGAGVPAPITAGVSASGKGVGVGVQAEYDLAKESLLKCVLLGGEFDAKLEGELNFELTSEKFNVSAGVVKARINWPDPLSWLKGTGDIKIIFVGVKWAEIKKDPDKLKVLAIGASLDLRGEGPLVLKNVNRVFKAKLGGGCAFTAAPNWANINAEVAKTGAATAEATTGAAGIAETLLAVDTAAVAGSAAAIALPVGAAALLVAGAMQTEKNIRAAGAGTAMGVKMRAVAKDYVKAYVSTLTGGSKAVGQGALEANAKVLEYMRVTGKNREEACADFVQKNGSDTKMSSEILIKFREQAFEKGVAEFEQQFSEQFGIVEGLGEKWGMRAVFRKNFRIVLYADE
jgi:Domain of unknown function (DUF4157)